MMLRAYWEAVVRRLGLVFWVLAAGAGLSGRAAEGDPGAGLPLKVGVSPIFPPMVFKQGKELVGAEVDLARALGRELGRPIQWVEVPWKEQVAALNAGRTDIIMSSMSVTTARGFVVAFTQPYLVVGQMALVRRTDRALYAIGFPNPPPGTVGVLRATTGEFLVERDFAGARMRSYADSESAVKGLIRRKIDLFVGDSTLVWHLAGVHEGDGLSVVPIPLSEERLAWGVRKGDASLLEAANGFLAKATRDGSLQNILRRWMAVAP